MTKYVARKLTLAFTLMLLITPAGSAFAKTDDCTDPQNPCVVGGGNPDPQVVLSTTSGSQVVTDTKPQPQIVMGDLRLLQLLQMA